MPRHAKTPTGTTGTHVDGTLALIDEKIAVAEQHLEQLRTARNAVAQAFGVAFGAAPTPSARKPTRMVPPKKTTRAYKPRAAATSSAAGPIEDKLRGFFQAQSAPVGMGEIEQTVKHSRYILTKAIDRLIDAIDAGDVVRIGKTSGMRFGTPAVMKAAKEEL